MIPAARGLTDGELAGEIAARLGVAWHLAPGHGAAAPRVQQDTAAAAADRRALLVAELVRELAAVAVLAPEPVPEPPAAADAEASADELATAQAAGTAAGQKLRGERTTVPPVNRARGYGAKQRFVIIQAAAVVADELAVRGRAHIGVVTGSYAEAEGYVCRPGTRAIADEAIFCGFRSTAEAAVYWEAARPGEELPHLPRRRFR